MKFYLDVASRSRYQRYQVQGQPSLDVPPTIYTKLPRIITLFKQPPNDVHSNERSYDCDVTVHQKMRYKVMPLTTPFCASCCYFTYSKMSILCYTEYAHTTYSL